VSASLDNLICVLRGVLLRFAVAPKMRAPAVTQANKGMWRVADQAMRTDLIPPWRLMGFA
jgi:hypothetical protein